MCREGKVGLRVQRVRRLPKLRELRATRDPSALIFSRGNRVEKIANPHPFASSPRLVTNQPRPSAPTPRLPLVLAADSSSCCTPSGTCTAFDQSYRPYRKGNFPWVCLYRFSHVFETSHRRSSVIDGVLLGGLFHPRQIISGTISRPIQHLHVHPLAV